MARYACGSGDMSERVIFSFGRDLRVGDHAGLAAAARLGDVVPVLIVDPLSAARLRRSPRRAAYYCAAVAALDAALRERGSALLVRRGAAGPILRGLARALGARAVAWSVAHDPQSVRFERDVQSVLEEAGIRTLPVHDATVIPPEDGALVNRRGEAYRSFAAYVTRWRSLVPVPREADASFAQTEIASEPLPDPAEFGATAPDDGAAGEAAARHALDAFLDGPAVHYASGRNVPAADGTSRLAAALSFGTIAARTVVREACARLGDPFLLAEERLSIKLYLRSLAQRDFFLQLAWYTESLEEEPLQEKMRGFAFARTHPQLDAWRSGRTGFPLVDAGMRELRATGWMHPRVRAVAASFLCFDLGIDWRVGRDTWEQWLVEDAPALATGNWQWIAGVGADYGSYPRIYNPLRAARRFDPVATYVRRWIPELAGQPDRTILDPLAAGGARQLALSLFGPREYPAPILDHEAAARAFLERYGREVRAASA
jgi:deoxyribodipyrimidine photo-lyase